MKTSNHGQNEISDYGIFRHTLSLGHDRLVQSTCNNCRVFVAASARPDLLDAIEKLHLCALQSPPLANLRLVPDS
ncbi:MAG TPA: hypothetical protein VGK24_14570 [Candidatus Angelobacter sp.]